MSLPKNNEEIHYVKIKLPSGKQIGVRGWRIKDEKELLFALESEENAEAEKLKYIYDFLKKCTDDLDKFDLLSENDIKKVCIEIRKLAKGETIDYNYTCKCGMRLNDMVNLTKHQTVKPFDQSPTVINEDLTITFKDLSYKKADELVELYGKTPKKFTYYYVINSVDGVSYKGQTYTTFTAAEVDEFLEDKKSEVLQKIYDAFDSKVSMVTLSQKITCLKCKKEVEITFGDLLSFLVL